MRPDGRAASGPRHATSPSSGRTKPQMTLKSVVLPAPLGPMTPTTSPGETVNETSSSAVSPPKRTRDRVDAQPLSLGALVGGHGIPFVPRGRDLHAQRHGATVWVAAPALIVAAAQTSRAAPLCAAHNYRSSSRRTGSARRASGSSPVMMSR